MEAQSFFTTSCQQQPEVREFEIDQKFSKIINLHVICRSLTDSLLLTENWLGSLGMPRGAVGAKGIEIWSEVPKGKPNKCQSDPDRISGPSLQRVIEEMISSKSVSDRLKQEWLLETIRKGTMLADVDEKSALDTPVVSERASRTVTATEIFQRIQRQPNEDLVDFLTRVREHARQLQSTYGKLAMDSDVLRTAEEIKAEQEALVFGCSGSFQVGEDRVTLRVIQDLPAFLWAMPKHGQLIQDAQLQARIAKCGNGKRAIMDAGPLISNRARVKIRGHYHTGRRLFLMRNLEHARSRRFLCTEQMFIDLFHIQTKDEIRRDSKLCKSSDEISTYFASDEVSLITAQSLALENFVSRNHVVPGKRQSQHSKPTGLHAPFIRNWVAMHAKKKNFGSFKLSVSLLRYATGKKYESIILGSNPPKSLPELQARIREFEASKRQQRKNMRTAGKTVKAKRPVKPVRRTQKTAKKAIGPSQKKPAQKTRRRKDAAKSPER